MPIPMKRPPSLRSLAAGLVLFAAALLSGCAGDADIVLYCAQDQVHAEPLIREFEARTGLKVRAEYDIEAHKTVGLVRRIRTEQARPRCDVFWNNEIAHTISLANDGLLATYDSPNAADIPETFRDPERRWTGFAARARVFIVSNPLMHSRQIPSTMWDLVDPNWKGDCGMARPLTGTTLTHITALYSVIGEERTREYLRGIKANEVNLTSGNATLMRQVREGQFAWGWTDTDDYWVAKQAGADVDVVFPDAEDDQIGTLFIPNTVCILKDAPHPDAAKQLVDYLLSAEVEERLAHSRSAQIPLHGSLQDMQHPLPIEKMKAMEIDYAELGEQIDARHAELKEFFLD